MKIYRIVAQAQNCGWSGDGSSPLRTSGTRAALRRALLKAARPYGRGAWARIYESETRNMVASVSLSIGFGRPHIFDGEAE